MNVSQVLVWSLLGYCLGCRVGLYNVLCLKGSNQHCSLYACTKNRKHFLGTDWEGELK